MLSGINPCSAGICCTGTAEMNKRDSDPQSNCSVRPMTQPREMKTKTYLYGVNTLDGDDAWEMFVASAVGDVPKLKTLLTKDPRLVNAQYWYQFPIHRAVDFGHAEIVKLLLENGADPGQSRYTYDSWDKLLQSARNNRHHEIELLLIQAMERRFNYSPDFAQLKAAIISRNAAGIEGVLQHRPALITAADALGNNALHWSVITRQLSLIEHFVDLGTPVDALRADGQSPVLLAVNGATDYWYRETRSKSHPSLRNTSVLVGSLLALGATYTISVAAAVGDQERILQCIHEDPDSAKRLDSSRLSPLTHASRSSYLHIVQMLLDCGADPNVAEECAPEGRALYEACCANHLPIAQLLLERGADPNAGVDSCECCLTIAEVYHGEHAKPLQELLLKHGAFLPPYHMNAQQLKQAIRDNSMVVRHDEFLRCVMQNCDTELLELLLSLDLSVIKSLEVGDELVYLKEPKFIERLLSQGLDPTRPNWLGRTLLEACRENGNDVLPNLYAKSKTEIDNH